MNSNTTLLTAQTCLDTSFDLVEKVAWAVDQPDNNKADANIQDNFDTIRDLVDDQSYTALAPHVPHETTVGFPLLSAEEVVIRIPAATPEAIAAQKAEMAKAAAAGQAPFHYTVTYTRWMLKADGKNPDRKRSKLARGRASATPNIAG